jgi:hypothetical protein
MPKKTPQNIGGIRFSAAARHDFQLGDQLMPK